eukprot:tig00021720_g23193.t1
MGKALSTRVGETKVCWLRRTACSSRFAVRFGCTRKTSNDVFDRISSSLSTHNLRSGRTHNTRMDYFLILGRLTTGGSPAGRASSFHDVQARSFSSAAALGGDHTQRHSDACADMFPSL